MTNAFLFQGQTLHLLPERALWWPEAGTLLVADVHLGKGATYRHLGVPVPEGTDDGTLARLDAVLARTRARRLTVLGDLLHAPQSLAPRTLARMERWRASHPGLDVRLVGGNHDARAGVLPASLGIEVVDEAQTQGPFVLCHEPCSHPGGYVLAGHLHPAVRLRGRADRLRLPCFWFGADRAVLPAFGEFTGGMEPRFAPGDRVFAVAGDRVMELPGALLGR